MIMDTKQKDLVKYLCDTYDLKYEETGYGFVYVVDEKEQRVWDGYLDTENGVYSFLMNLKCYFMDEGNGPR